MNVGRDGGVCCHSRLCRRYRRILRILQIPIPMARLVLEKRPLRCLVS